MMFLFGGVNAAGKTTLLKHLASSGEFEYIHLTSALLRHMGLSTYDELRRFPQDYNRRKLSEVIRMLASATEPRPRLLDGHYLNLRHGRVSRICDGWVQELSGLVLVQTPTPVILERLHADARDRALFGRTTPPREYETRLEQYSNQVQEEFERLASRYQRPNIIISGLNFDQAAADFRVFYTSLR